jgi:hypothetical protein
MPNATVRANARTLPAHHPDDSATVIDRLKKAGATIAARDELPDGRVQLVVSNGSELHRLVIGKRERNRWIIAGNYAAIALLTWTVMLVALLVFKAVMHV